MTRLPARPLASIDRTVRLVAGQVAHLGPPPPFRVLADLRRDAMAATLPAHRPAADAAIRALAAGDARGRDQLAAVAERALLDMRRRVASAGRGRGGLVRLAATADARWGDCDEPELLDDPELRAGIMDTLDASNGLFGSYHHFLDALLPHLVADRPTRVLDLAAGHGGFTLAAAAAAEARGMPVRFTASDIKAEYLAMGEAEARRRGLDVDFVVQDALDLSNLEAGAFDIVLCTQSLHHFPPGLVAVMFEAATRVARSAVVFIDVCRGAMPALAVLAAGRLRYRNAAFVHDGWISARRAFIPQELELLARLGSRGDQAEARWAPPAHCLLTWRPEG